MIKKIQGMKSKKGFTLVELLVVIAIIGILAAILIPLMSTFLGDARVQNANATASSGKSTAIAWVTSQAAYRGQGMINTGGDVTVRATWAAGTNWTINAADITAAYAASFMAGTKFTEAQIQTANSFKGQSLEALLNDNFPDPGAGANFMFVFSQNDVVAVAYSPEIAVTAYAAPDFSTANGVIKNGKDQNGYIVGSNPAT